MYHAQVIRQRTRCSMCQLRRWFMAMCGMCRALLRFERYERYELPIRVVLFLADLRSVILVVGALFFGWNLTHE